MVDDTRVVLFVVTGRRATSSTTTCAIGSAPVSAAHVTPRHVPAVIAEVPEIPRTRSGKIVELAVRDVVHGRAVKNTEALANPEALDAFRDHPALSS